MTDRLTPKPLQNCGKCGLCLTACPVYKVLKEEQASPRARLQLIKAFEKGDMESSPLLKDLINKCLMCGSCAAACPSGINHYAKFMDMRRDMARSQGDTPAIKSLIFLLSREYRLRMGAGMAKLGQRMTPSALADKYKLGNIPVSRFPKMNATPFRNTLPETIPPNGKKRGSLVYFTGCATHYLFDDTGTATVSLLTGLGYEVIIPKGQTCCGIPLMFHGAIDQAVENMAANILALGEAFETRDIHRVIVDCTTCGAALKDEYPGLMEKIADRPDADLPDDLDFRIPGEAAEKVQDLLSFIHEHRGELTHAPANEKIRAVYHAPCHTRNAFNSTPAILELISDLPGVDLVPLPDTDACCGGGGTFFYEYPEVAAQMMETKLKNARNADARYWLTDCPVCRINLSGNLTNQDTMDVLHPVSLISRGLDLS